MKKVGVIMLNTRFPRLLGDIGNSQSFDIECEFICMEKSRVSNIVVDNIADELIEEITLTARKLQDNDATIITTSCGFLGLVQERIQNELHVPFIASSLMLTPFLRTLFGPKSTIGVLTFDSKTLSHKHFNRHHDSNIIIAGIENGHELHRVIKNDETYLNRKLAEQDALQTAESLVEQGASCLLLECTNLSPYKSAIRKKTSLPVFDLVDTINWFCRS